MGRMMQKEILGIKRSGSVLADIGTVRQQGGGFGGVPKLCFANPLKNFAYFRVADGTGDFYPSVQISCHQVGRSQEKFGFAAAPELVNSRVLQKTPDNAGDMNVFGFLRDFRQ